MCVRMELKGKKKMRMHGLFKIVRKLVSDGFQQKVREQQARKYEKVFMFNTKLMAPGDEPTSLERVDLAPHIPRVVRDVITRREGTTWFVMTTGEKPKSAKIVAKERMKAVVDFAVDQGLTMKELRTGFEMIRWQGYQRAPELWEDDGRIPPRKMGIGTPQKGIGGKTGTADVVGTSQRSTQRSSNATSEASEDSAPETTLLRKSPPRRGGGNRPKNNFPRGRSRLTPQ
jgi:hypothetical protein